MFDTSEHSTSKTAISSLTRKLGNADIEIEDMEGNEDSSSMWCIDDDTLFYAKGLKHHSAGKGKSVYVTWNENYLINFVFKTSSKIGTTTLTKVRIAIPTYEQDLEEISNMLILEMNTLLYMKSGRVYYFSSVKSMHQIDWLSGIRCVSSCPLTQFSVIRLVSTSDHATQDQKKVLNLEVYKDVPQLGKCFCNDVLKRCYDISFDLENIFNCHWSDETYTLTSLITDERNITFLKQLVSIGNIFHPQAELAELNINQEIHIFTISRNIFVLIGAIVAESEVTPSNPEDRNFSIHLLNTYACAIECVRIDCDNNLLIVLLQSGHMDVWYKSECMFGAILHCQHEMLHFLDYDFWPAKNIFYFTTTEEVIELKIITSNKMCIEKECIVKETRKSVGGMIACTFVEGLQQLICLSINNIFYRFYFSTILESTNQNETQYENLNNLYALNNKRIKDLAAKAHIVHELMEKPKYLHNAIEKEFRKQQTLALETKSETLKKMFQCHLEYHVRLPVTEFYDNDYVHIKAINHQTDTQSIFCLIYISAKNSKNNVLASILSTSIWYLHISSAEGCSQMYVPYQNFNKKLCFIVEMPLKQHVKQILPYFSLNLLTFFSHPYHSTICLKYNLNIHSNQGTFSNLFSCNIQNLRVFRKSFDAVTNLFRKESNIAQISVMKSGENAYKIKQRHKIPRTVLQNVLETVIAKPSWLFDLNFKMYYLHQYLIELNYDDSEEILLICSNYPVAIFYIKLLLVNAMQSNNDVDIIDTSVHNLQQVILNYHNDIENLYGSLISSADATNPNTITMDLENLRSVYIKLRIDFYDIFK